MRTNDDLALYRRLEFPNETVLSWPLAVERDDDLRSEWPRLKQLPQTQPAPSGLTTSEAPGE